MSIFDFSYVFPSTIEELDKFSGKEFEVFLFHFFEALGYSPRLTDDTYDKGIDLIIRSPHNGTTKSIGIQAKRWKSKVGADEIRSMLDGKGHYNLDEVWIITTSDLTSSAITTAMNNKIEILTRDRVKLFLEELKKQENIKFREPPTKVKKVTQAKIEKESPTDPLTEDLKALRLNLAKTHKKYPIYLVYNNATIEDLVSKKPQNANDLVKINGFSAEKVTLFGNDVLEVIKKHVHSLGDKTKVIEKLLLIRRRITSFNNLKNDFAAFNDIALNELAEKLPKTIEELKSINGFTEEKIKLFGAYLIKAITALDN